MLSKQFWLGVLCCMVFWVVMLHVISIPEYTIIIQRECTNTI